MSVEQAIEALEKALQKLFEDMKETQPFRAFYLLAVRAADALIRFEAAARRRK